MTTVHAPLQKPSLIEDGISLTRLSWLGFTIATTVILALLLVVAAYLDQALQGVLQPDGLRLLVTCPVMILYILIMLHVATPFSAQAIQAMQRLLDVDEAKMAQLIAPMSPSRRSEWLAALGGVMLGLVFSPPWILFAHFTWLNLYAWVTQLLMMAMLGTVIYSSSSETVLLSRLQNHPLRIDLFDMAPFETLGQFALSDALAIIGGSTLVVLLMPAQYVVNLFNIILNGLLLSVAVVGFFFSLRGTHRIMVEAKTRELGIVRAKLSAAFEELKARGAESTSGGKFDTVGVWLAYEKRLAEVPEWPFNTAMLRNLFVSVLVPGATFLGRLLLGISY